MPRATKNSSKTAADVNRSAAAGSNTAGKKGIPTIRYTRRPTHGSAGSGTGDAAPLLFRCSKCDNYAAKSKAGLSSHMRAKHPTTLKHTSTPDPPARPPDDEAEPLPPGTPPPALRTLDRSTSDRGTPAPAAVFAVSGARSNVDGGGGGGGGGNRPAEDPPEYLMNALGLIYRGRLVNTGAETYTLTLADGKSKIEVQWLLDYRKFVLLPDTKAGRDKPLELQLACRDSPPPPLWYLLHEDSGIIAKLPDGVVKQTIELPSIAPRAGTPAADTSASATAPSTLKDSHRTEDRSTRRRGTSSNSGRSIGTGLPKDDHNYTSDEDDGRSNAGPAPVHFTFSPETLSTNRSKSSRSPGVGFGVGAGIRKDDRNYPSDDDSETSITSPARSSHNLSFTQCGIECSLGSNGSVPFKSPGSDGDCEQRFENAEGKKDDAAVEADAGGSTEEGKEDRLDAPTAPPLEDGRLAAGSGTAEDATPNAAVVTQADLNEFRNCLRKLTTDVVDLKEDVEGVKEDVEGVKEDVEGVKEDVEGVKEDVEELFDNDSEQEKAIVTTYDYVQKKLMVKEVENALEILEKEDDVKKVEGAVENEEKEVDVEEQSMCCCS